MAMSTKTAPGNISLSWSRRINFGVLAPGTRTAPMIRSDSNAEFAMVSGVAINTLIRPENSLASARRRSVDWSITVTSACRPIAIWAALVPAIPPPKIVTLAGATPGTPPSNVPLPPLVTCNAVAPACTDKRPATSLMGASNGKRPLASVTVS